MLAITGAAGEGKSALSAALVATGQVQVSLSVAVGNKGSAVCKLTTAKGWCSCAG